MLQTIRDKSQGIIALLIILFVCVTFALWGIHNYFNGSSATSPVVKVNNQSITQQQFSVAFQRFRQQQMQQSPDAFSSQQAINVAKKQLLDSMVTSMLLTQAATKSHFDVGPMLLELEIANMPAFQVNGVFSKLRFQELLSAMMYTQDEFLQTLKESMLVAQVRAGFVAPAFVLPYQVANTIQLVNQKRSFNYVTIPAAQFLSGIKVTDAQVQDYYQSHQKEFSLPQKVSLQYISLSLPDLMKKVQPTDSQLAQYYQDNINHYTTPKKWDLAHILIAIAPDATAAEVKAAQAKAQAVYAQLKSGKSFSDLVAQNSDDTGTAKTGGALPTVNLLQLNSDWQQQLVSLKDGDFSQPFKTQQGFEIVKVVKTTPAIVQPYASVQAKVRTDYIQQTAEKNFSDLSDQLANLTFENPSSLDAAAKQLNLPVQTTALFSQQGGDDAFTKNIKIITAAFSNEVFNQGNNSDVIALSDDQAVVIRINQKVAASVKPLNDVKAEIISKLQQKMASDKALAVANQILQGINQHQSLQTLAQQNKVIMQSVQLASRNNNPRVNSNLVHAAFALNVPANNLVSAGIVPVNNSDSAVVQLIAVQDGNLAAVPDTVKKFYTSGMARSAGILNYALYVDGLKQKAKIKYFQMSES